MLFLSKIHEGKYINDMYQNEYLYFKWLECFRGNADSSGRLDPRELNLKTEQIKIQTISAEGKKISVHELNKEFKGQYNEHLTDAKINCCSLHWLEVEPDLPPSTFHEKLLLMGDKMLLIYDWRKFFDILDTTLEKLNFQYSRKKVYYYDPKNHNGELTLHHKDIQLKYQNEYRILIAPTEQQSINIPLKGLRGISTIINTKDYQRLSIEICRQD